MKSESGQDRDVEFEFAGFRLDPDARLLLKRDGTPVKLNSRAFDTLVVLVARPGATLSKRFLLNAVWPDVVVGDNNLNQAIAAIRRALGDNDATRRIIQTIPGRGFCFVAEVQVVASSMLPALTEAPCRDAIVTVADYFC
jgi:DNA-binding winged helix-turn-helix (wHTH) protein